MEETQLVKYLIRRIEAIDTKVDEMLKFKWQIVGGSVVLSCLISIVVQIVIVLFKS